MRRALDPEHDLIGDDEAPRDLVLGIPALLGIFVAAVLVCAVCFGYGYSSGHGLHFPSAQSSQPSPPALAAKSSPMPVPSQTDTAGDTNPDGGQTASLSGSDSQTRTEQDAAPNPSVAPAYAKPNPGMAYQAPSAPAVRANSSPGQNAIPAQTYQPARTAPQTSEYAPAAPAPASQTRPSAPAVSQNAKAAKATPVTQANDEPEAQTVGAPIALMVQIAAVTQFSDAQTLATALRHDGFNPIVRTTTGDPYFHVQVGPFSSYESAKAMRQRLTTGGYSAFIRH